MHLNSSSRQWLRSDLSFWLYLSLQMQMIGTCSASSQVLVKYCRSLSDMCWEISTEHRGSLPAMTDTGCDKIVHRSCCLFMSTQAADIVNKPYYLALKGVKPRNGLGVGTGIPWT